MTSSDHEARFFAAFKNHINQIFTRKKFFFYKKKTSECPGKIMNNTLLSTFCVLFTVEIVKEIFVIFLVYFFGGLECVDYSFAYVAHFVFLRDVRIRTQRELPQ
jgi:hypothetical protein